MKSIKQVILGMALLAAVEAKRNHRDGGFVESRFKNLATAQANSNGNFEGGLVRSTLGPAKDADEHLDFMKSDSNEEDYQNDSPKGYEVSFADRTTEYLRKQHHDFMQLQAQDTVIVPVEFTSKSIGQSRFRNVYIEGEADEDESHFEARDRHTDDDEYDQDSPVGYRHRDD